MTELIELFHTPEGRPYATIRVNGDTRNVEVKRKGIYERFVLQQAYEAGMSLSSTDLKERIQEDASKAMFDENAEEREVYIRVAPFREHEWTGKKAKITERIYIDLASDGSAIEVTGSGWKVVPSPVVKFRRDGAMYPLPEPVPGGDIHLLKNFINLDGDDYLLFLAVLVSAFRYNNPLPILLITGEHGSGKTTLARVFRHLVDPSKVPVTTAPRNEQDLLIAAKNSWVVNIDNQSDLSIKMSDNLCRLATRTALRTRTLYTTDEETVFEALRPILMNSIEELATRSDFLDRMIHVHTKNLGKKRKSEQEMWGSFDAVAPQILGGLMDAVSLAMRKLPSVTEDFHEFRMNDFARWSFAAMPALGFTGDEFITAYRANRAKCTNVALDASPIYIPLRNLLEKGDFRGTTKELLLQLDPHMFSDPERPRTPRALTSMLERLIPNLRADGVTVKHLGRDSYRRVQILEITKVRSAKEMKAEALVSEAREKGAADDAATEGRSINLPQCQKFLADVLSYGPMKRRDVRRMAEGQRPLPDGKMTSAKYASDVLEKAAKKLGVITLDKGKDGGIWWVLTQEEEVAAAAGASE